MQQVIAQMKKALSNFENFEGVTTKALEDMQGHIDRLEIQLTMLSGNQVQRDTRLGEWNDEATAVRFIDFMRDVRAGDQAQIRALSEGTDSEGGHLVPQEFVPTLLRFIEQYGLLRKDATVIPMNKGDEKKFPNLASGVTVYWPGESGAITESEPSFGEILLTAKKMAALIPSSSELVEDSSIEIATLLASIVGEAMAKEEDRVGLAGDVSGSGDPFNGVLIDSTVASKVMAATKTSFQDANADDLLDLQTAIPVPAMDGAKYYMHRTIFDVIRKLKDDNGNYIYAQPAGNQPGTIWGYPYAMSEVMPGVASTAADTPFVIFGNLKYLYLGDRKRLTVMMSPHYKFNLDQLYFRYLQRIAIRVAQGSGLVTLKTSAV